MFFISELLLGNPLYNVFLFNHVPPSRRGVVASEGRCPAHILGTCRCNLFNSGAWKSYIITDCIAALSEEKWRGNGWYQEWETVDFCWHLRTLTATWQRQTMLKSFCCCPFQFSAKKEKTEFLVSTSTFSVKNLSNNYLELHLGQKYSPMHLLLF